MKKTRKQLRKMEDADVVAYLLKNHYWHIVKFYKYEHQTCPGSTKYFKIAGFRLSQDFFMSEYGGYWKDSYYSRTGYTLFDVKTREYVHISQTDGNTLYNRLKHQYETRHTRRIILLTLLLALAILAGHEFRNRKYTKQQSTISTLNTDPVLTFGPYEKTTTFYYENEHQH